MKMYLGLLISIYTHTLFFGVAFGQQTGSFFRFNGSSVFENEAHMSLDVGYTLLFQGTDLSPGQFRVIRSEGEVTEFFNGRVNASGQFLDKKILTVRRDEDGAVKNVEFTSQKTAIDQKRFIEIYEMIEEFSKNAEFLEDSNETDFSTMYYIGIVGESGLRKSAWSCRVKVQPKSDLEKFDELLKFLFAL